MCGWMFSLSVCVGKHVFVDAVISLTAVPQLSSAAQQQPRQRTTHIHSPANLMPEPHSAKSISTQTLEKTIFLQ